MSTYHLVSPSESLFTGMTTYHLVSPSESLFTGMSTYHLVSSSESLFVPRAYVFFLCQHVLLFALNTAEMFCFYDTCNDLGDLNVTISTDGGWHNPFGTSDSRDDSLEQVAWVFETQRQELYENNHLLKLIGVTVICLIFYRNCRFIIQIGCSMFRLNTMERKRDREYVRVYEQKHKEPFPNPTAIF